MTEANGLVLALIIHTRGDPLAEQVQQELLFAGGRVLQQLGQSLGLLGVERKSGNALGFPGGGQLAVSAQHGDLCSGMTTILPDRVCCQ